MPRNLKATHQDSADRVWLDAAAALGITVVRSADAYAAWDGQGTLTLASDDYLDPDDCLAQMLLHEICHLLISGEAARHKPDWGLDNTTPKDLVYEYATNRLQAALAGAYGLRQFMAVTTMWRAYYDALPRDPLHPLDTDPAIALARAGLERARQATYREVLDTALSATAALAETLRPVVSDDSLWTQALAPHPTGFHRHRDDQLTCGTCAWAIPAEGGVIECRMTRPGCRSADYRLGDVAGEAKAVRLSPTHHACEYFEPVFDERECLRCGACCHQGFDVVDVGAVETFATRHPDLIAVRDDGRRVVPRPGGRCVALDGTGASESPYLCRHYDDRPRACRDFAVAGDACLVARQRVNLA